MPAENDRPSYFYKCARCALHFTSPVPLENVPGVKLYRGQVLHEDEHGQLCGPVELRRVSTWRAGWAWRWMTGDDIVAYVAGDAAELLDEHEHDHLLWEHTPFPFTTVPELFTRLSVLNACGQLLSCGPWCGNYQLSEEATVTELKR